MPSDEGQAPAKIYRHIGALRVRFAALLAALAIYALAGYPTPPAFGWSEMAVGILLFFAVGADGAAQIFVVQDIRRWPGAAQVLLLYGLTVPVAAGLVNGADPALMLRDLVPFLFLLLPLLLRPRGRVFTAREKMLLTGAVAASGWCFGARVVLAWAGQRAAPAGGPPLDPDYLANAPTVLFAALLLLGFAEARLYRSLVPRSVLQAACFAALALVPAAATMLVSQRASAGAIAGFAVGAAGIAFARRPARGLPLVLILLLAVVLAAGTLAPLAGELLQKTRDVGLNMRWQEANAVEQALGPSPLGVLFGRGWGATVASPAVGGVVVNYTHSFLTTYWLKTGLCGLTLALAYLAMLARDMLGFPARRALLAAALALPLLIDVTLYASFKSLDFGLLLFVVTLWPQPAAGQSAVALEERTHAFA